MSFMPSPGTIVRLTDQRVAIVVSASPLGDNDRVLLASGAVEPIDAFQIEEIVQPAMKGPSALTPPRVRLLNYLGVWFP